MIPPDPTTPDLEPVANDPVSPWPEGLGEWEFFEVTTEQPDHG